MYFTLRVSRLVLGFYGLTEEKLIETQQGEFSCLMKPEDVDEYKITTVNKLGRAQESNEAAQRSLTNAKKALVCLSLQCLSLHFVLMRTCG